MHTAAIGKQGELFVFGELLQRGIVPYVPLVDMEGVDAIIRLDAGCYREIQVKKLEKQKDVRWFQVRNLRASEHLFIICVERDDTVWVFPSRIFQKFATKSETRSGIIYDLNLDGRSHGRGRTRKDLLAPYRNNWNLLIMATEALDDLIAMYESMAAPEEESLSLEQYKRLRAQSV
ncbi:MAG: hypothetical protein HYU88_04820 [Chloroflexi bacterium]|nr:hypothetical protein [Chloroflexota bacterium]